MLGMSKIGRRGIKVIKIEKIIFILGTNPLKTITVDISSSGLAVT